MTTTTYNFLQFYWEAPILIIMNNSSFLNNTNNFNFMLSLGL